MPPRRRARKNLQSLPRGAPADAVKSSTPMKCLPRVPSAIPACMSLIIGLWDRVQRHKADRSVGIDLSSALIESHRFLLKGIENRLWRCGQRGTNDLAGGMICQDDPFSRR